MSEKGSVFQKGGGGHEFEKHIQTAFLTTMIIRGVIPCFSDAEIKEIAFQTTNRGYETDDLLVIAKSGDVEHKLIAQIKHNVNFSDNEEFRKVLLGMWKDFNNPSVFDKDNDRLVLIKSRLTLDEKNHVKVILNWARTHCDCKDFLSEVERIKAKKKSYYLIKNALKESLKTSELGDDEFWKFLKCLDILKYDFLQESSVAKTDLLNIIRLTKSDSTTLTEEEIWNKLYSLVSTLNPNGGSVDQNSIDNDVLNHFEIKKIVPFKREIKILERNGELILKPIKSSIREIHFDRTELRSTLISTLNKMQFVILSGAPGAGKSAVVKELLEKEFSEYTKIVFKADQLNRVHLAESFSDIGVNEAVPDIMASIALVPDTVIFIDSLEKLLEGDNENAFAQLISLLEVYPDIKIISSARKFAIESLLIKFNIDRNRCERLNVSDLNDAELRRVVQSYPDLNDAINNVKLNALLRSPKYLDLSLQVLPEIKKNSDLSTMSLTVFKQKMWQMIIEKRSLRKNGLSRKRDRAFISLAVKRSKKMRMFVEPDEGHEEAIESLEQDEVIVRGGDEYQFSPAHDIFEDWGLIKYIKYRHGEADNIERFFIDIGTEPAMRRAFRLWVEEEIVDSIDAIVELVDYCLQDDAAIERFWGDELLVAIFKSLDCSNFIEEFSDRLLEDSGGLFRRCIRVLRTACKEYYNPSWLKPVGSGWREFLYFIDKEKNSFNSYRFKILGLLEDWHGRLLLESGIGSKEKLAAKNVILYYINQIESGDQFWLANNSKLYDVLIRILFNLSDVARQEITQFVNRCLTAINGLDYSNLKGFYLTVVSKCLSGFGNGKLIEQLPELVIRVAWDRWKLKEPEEVKGAHNYKYGTAGDYEYWGINDRHYFNPPSEYKVPIYNLLWHYPKKALKFICNFINYSVEFYHNGRFPYKQSFHDINISLNDGTEKKMYASERLWWSYRDLTGTNDLIKSILISLEKYLLELAEKRTEESRQLLRESCRYLLKESNNVTVCGVLTSIAIAYPKEMGEEMLPLLGVKEFYWWDLHRAGADARKSIWADNELPSNINSKRYEFHNLEHRRKYRRGLADFIFEYQFFIRDLNVRIYVIFDKLIAQKDEDLMWKSLLTQIDCRNCRFGDYDESLKGFPIEVEYSKEVAEHIDHIEEISVDMDNYIKYSALLMRVYDKEIEFTYSDWQKCYKYYTQESSLNSIFEGKGNLASIGLRDFRQELCDEENYWCEKYLLSVLQKIIDKKFRLADDQDLSINIFEEELAIKSIHLLYQNSESHDKKNVVLKVILKLLVAPPYDRDIKMIIEYIRDEFLGKNQSELRKLCSWLIVYSKYLKEKPLFLPNAGKEELHDNLVQHVVFIEQLVSKWDFSNLEKSLNFDNCHERVLVTAFLILPYVSNHFNDYRTEFIKLVLEDLKKSKSDSYRRTDKDRKLSFDHIWEIKIYLVDYFIKADFYSAKEMFDLISHEATIGGFEEYRLTNEDLYGFCVEIPKLQIASFNEKIIEGRTIENHLVERFWDFWEYMYEKVKKEKLVFYEQCLLLDVGWSNENNWPILKGRKAFYKKMLVSFGKRNTLSLINVLATIGDKELLPEGLLWLVQAIVEDRYNALCLMYNNNGKRLIEKLYYNYVHEMKGNKALIEAYVFILDLMVEMESADAYQFRENVITYKIGN